MLEQKIKNKKVLLTLLKD